MAFNHESQQDRAIAFRRERGMARLSESGKAGITAATVSRMKERGLVLQLGRGLYQLADASFDSHHALAEAAKLVPKGVVRLISALAFHELTDTISRGVWMAIGPKDRRPNVEKPRLVIVRFGPKVFSSGIEEHVIEGVKVRIFNPAKTVVDLLRYRQRAGQRYQKSSGLNLALEGLREALRQRKATPAEIGHYAEEGGVRNALRPYLEAMTANASASQHVL
jgi:predicted transcriptional regulator of viral defense system